MNSISYTTSRCSSYLVYKFYKLVLRFYGLSILFKFETIHKKRYLLVEVNLFFIQFFIVRPIKQIINTHIKIIGYFH
jgi:hypothetical protein